MSCVMSLEARVRYAAAAWRRADAAYIEAGRDASPALAEAVDDALARLDEARALLVAAR